MLADLPPHSSRIRFIVVAGRGHHLAADDRAAGEADHVDPRVDGQQLAGFDAGRRDDVDHTRRNVGVLVDDSGQRQTGQRRQRRRLEHDGIARGQRGADFITLRLCGKFHGVRIDTTPSGS